MTAAFVMTLAAHALTATIAVAAAMALVDARKQRRDKALAARMERAAEARAKIKPVDALPARYRRARLLGISLFDPYSRTIGVDLAIVAEDGSCEQAIFLRISEQGAADIAEKLRLAQVELKHADLYGAYS